ncbi:MAG: twin-arginine translocase TatA/TatE family subunit [Planctomycetia bacterium]|nr:twin-arginine translocase TatA/TatE family subunit [Planctomycetia bacterium]
MSPFLAFLPNIGIPELLVVGLVVLLLFGNRLPTLMRSLGRGVVEFKKGVQGIDEDSAGRGEDLDSASKRESAPVDSRRGT